jgi:hypothetical protein
MIGLDNYKNASVEENITVVLTIVGWGEINQLTYLGSPSLSESMLNSQKSTWKHGASSHESDA